MLLRKVHISHDFDFYLRRACITLFCVATLAGWNMVMDAAYAATGSLNTRLFFFIYRMTISNILLPIFVGFLVESFVSNARSVETRYVYVRVC